MLYRTLASVSDDIDPTPIQPYPPNAVDVERFNTLIGDAGELNWVGQPLTAIEDLFVKSVILDDETTLTVETVRVPGFIGISDAPTVLAPDGNEVSGHRDVADVLARDGLLVCTFQWHKERFGVPLDTRQPMGIDLFQEAFIKNEAHHAGALVPAQQPDKSGAWVETFAAHNEPGSYHNGMYGDDGFVAVAQRLVFPDFFSRQQARGYTDSIVSWMGLLNPVVKFPKDYNGGDPTRVSDRATLKAFLQMALWAVLGDRDAVRFLNDPQNMTYCAEYIYIALNTVLYPFNRRGLTDLLNDEAAAGAILDIQAQHNRHEPTILSQKSEDADFEALLNRTPSNPEFDAFHIAMPVVPDNLPPIDVLMAEHKAAPKPNSLPFPPFTISQILRRAFRTMLPRHQNGQEDSRVAAAQGRMLLYLEEALIQQLGLDRKIAADDPRRQLAHQYTQLIAQRLAQPFASKAAFDQTVDRLMAKADMMLVGAGDRTRFVPPRIYVDLGQRDSDDTLPQGWGFRLETVGALISRRVIGAATRKPLTWRILRSTTPTMRGDDVKLLQGTLIRHGFTVEADGMFGPQSTAAVREFQSSQGIEETGIIDHETRQRLLT
ncbi:MAG: peptidoglycan-binding domain-containing protein [Elainellaceae cyanobacterium]